ncbi:IS630 family transposase [Shinella sp.]|uniref:IS630 family transposase n=1 Tax=Shinella sp. TaxID=1870904 RepID=UPI00259032CE|nr:IS630 family transposase [Shinella sp.]MCW5712876.1 IS630 family transposase [Shinella sp.]
MARPYSVDLRERVILAVVQGGLSCNQAAARFGIGIKTAIDWVRRFRETGSLAAKPMGGRRPKKIVGEYREWLLQRCQRDFTLRGLVAELAERGLQVDYRTVWDFVHGEELTFKKTLVASERERPDVARRRLQWMAYQGRIDPARLVFIDETWTKTNMAPLRGWAPCGQRLPGKAPHGRWKTMTFLAALRHDRVTAPWLIDGPIDGQSFLQYVEEILVPTLKPGDIVIIDNLGSHKGKAIRKAIRAARAKLFFLPKYSPDLNPIEQLFAKLKHWLRKAATRTDDALCDAIARVLPLVSSAECANYFANAGYSAT